jgi:hypothetical protein
MRAVVLCLLGLVCACGASEEPLESSDAAVGGGGGAAAGSSDGGGAAGGGTTGGGTTGGGAAGGGDAASPSPDAGGSGGTGGSTGGAADAGPGVQDAGGGGEQLPKFSFFVTSLASLRKLSKSQSGFGGDLTYGETGEGAGLRGADKICAENGEAVARVPEHVEGERQGPHRQRALVRSHRPHRRA